MKIAFIGCVQFSYAALEKLLTLPQAELVGVVTRRESPANADFRSLEPLASQAKVPCFFADGKDQVALAAWLRGVKPDVVFCFGWSQLLPASTLAIPRLGVVGYHPAALPQNRGRHPIIWTLALGLPRTASTFFFMDEGADSGDILSQATVEIAEMDDAGSLYAKLIAVALKQIAEFTPKLAGGSFERRPQDHAKANLWRKRGKLDGQIDWRMSARSIHNLVRALARPYPGAHCVRGGQDVKIWKTALLDSAPPNLEPGKVLQAAEGAFVVKCGEGALRIVEHEFPVMPKEGDYL